MKKFLFIAFTALSFSNIASAQSKETNAAMTPPPSQAEIARDTRIKLASRPQTPAQIKENADSYKKAGLTPNQMTSMKQFDAKRAEIEKNTQINATQKEQELMMIETERQAMLKKTLGDAKYEKYLAPNPPKAIVTPKSSKIKSN
ncbi:MAG: hypothetical protein ABIT58_05470 [Ferruginibacter sp.]